MQAFNKNTLKVLCYKALKELNLVPKAAADAPLILTHFVTEYIGIIWWCPTLSQLEVVLRKEIPERERLLRCCCLPPPSSSPEGFLDAPIVLPSSSNSEQNYYTMYVKYNLAYRRLSCTKI